VNKEEQFVEMSDAEKEVARLTLSSAQDLVAKGDLRGYTRLLSEASELCNAQLRSKSDVRN
jgi:hypothetical protein